MGNDFYSNPVDILRSINVSCMQPNRYIEKGAFMAIGSPGIFDMFGIKSIPMKVLGKSFSRSFQSYSFSFLLLLYLFHFYPFPPQPSICEIPTSKIYH